MIRILYSYQRPYLPYMVLNSLFEVLPYLAMALLSQGIFRMMILGGSLAREVLILSGGMLIIYLVYQCFLRRLLDPQWMYRVRQDIEQAYLRNVIEDPTLADLTADVYQQDMRGLFAVDTLLMTVLPDVLRSLMLLGVFAIYMFQLGNYFIAWLPVVALCLIIWLRRSVQQLKRTVDATNIATARQLNQRFLEYLKGIVTLISYGSGSHYQQKFQEVSEAYHQSMMQSLQLSLLSSLSTRSVIFLTLTCFIVLMGNRVGLSSTMTSLFLLYPLIVSYQKIGYYFRSYYSQRHVINRVLERIGDATTAQSTIAPQKSSQEYQHIDQIQLKNVTFGYDQRILFDDISAHIHLGALTCLIGANGSGKSTLFKLLLQLETPQQGHIYYDDIPLVGMPYEAIYDQVGYVTSDSYLFSGTIAENICVGNPERQGLTEWLHEEQLCEFIHRLPDGLATQVGEGGKWLSRGQRQQIALARQLWLDKPIYLLDEMTSGIDQASASAMMACLQRWKDRAIIILITHRVNEWDQCDHTIYLNNQRVICASPKQLEEESISYRQLKQATRLEEEVPDV